MIVEAALETLKNKGFARSSAREIARTGGFNQALIFYHFGSVQHLLLAALDLVSERRLRAYQPALEEAQTLVELATLARDVYREDVGNGYVRVLGEMVAGAVADPELGREVVDRLTPWVGLVEHKITALVDGSALGSLIPAGDIAFAIIALYLGIDMLAHLEGDQSRAESLLALASQVAPVVQLLLPVRVEASISTSGGPCADR